jgi:hypothetical protein
MMLGTIDATDWAAIGTALGALIALIKGFQAGDKDKKADPALPAKPSTFADVELLAQAISLNTAAVAKLTVVIEQEAKRHEMDDKVEERLTLKLLAEQIKPRG